MAHYLLVAKRSNEGPAFMSSERNASEYRRAGCKTAKTGARGLQRNSQRRMETRRGSRGRAGGYDDREIILDK